MDENAERAGRATDALRAYGRRLGDPHADLETILKDLITDFMHAVAADPDRAGIDPHDVVTDIVASARNHFSAERAKA